VAFFVHDLGYFGKPNMDGEEGETHPYLGAKIMHFLFDGYESIKPYKYSSTDNYSYRIEFHSKAFKKRKYYWYNFTLYHSRFLAKKHGVKPSQLCIADKLAIYYTPAWLYLPMVKFTGEIKEYMKDTGRNSGGELKYTSDPAKWFAKIQGWVKLWVEDHKNGEIDKKTVIRKQRKTK
jgi:hypothetical protein